MADALTEVERRVKEAVFLFCEEQGFAYRGRRKGLASVAEKLETGRYRCWSELEDLFACTVIIPTLGEEPHVLDHLRRIFSEDQVKHRGSTIKRADIFRFDATRFVGRLKRSGPAEGDDLFQIRFEVQIQTVFEHAWSTTTHAVYKPSTIDWKTARLAAQMKAAIEQLDALVLAFDESAEMLVEHPWPELETKKKILAVFRGLHEQGIIPDESIPEMWGRFADNLRNLFVAANDKHQPSKRKVAGMLNICAERARSYGKGRFPRSISLFQFVFGTLVEAGEIKLPLAGFCPLITDGMRLVFPAFANVRQCVDLES